MGFVWSSRSSKRSRRAGVPMSPSWLQTFRPAWRTLVDRSAHPAVGNGLAGSSGRQPHPETGTQGDATLGDGEAGAPPLSQALSARPPAATAPSSPPATRQRVVLLPHARTDPTDIRPPNRRAGRTTDLNRDDCPRHHPAHDGGTTSMITANTQWHDAELALKMARHSYDRWLITGGKDTRSPAIMHAYHTRGPTRGSARHHHAHRNIPRRGGLADHHPGAWHRHPRSTLLT